jgi:3-oxoadipate enol-lactonase
MPDYLIDANDAAIYLKETGAGEPALVFLHYWGGSSRTWSRVIDRLEGKPRCIAIDQRGWGASIAGDGRYDLSAMADDAVEVARQLGLGRYVLVGHSMGGKVAQIVAARDPKELVGLVLVAPAPPTPMPVPEAVRAGMLQSYGSREGVLQALAVPGGEALPNELREQVIEDTLRGAPEAKSAWTECGMVEDVTKGLDAVGLPVTVVVGDRDQVEHEDTLKEVFARFLPQATFRRLRGVGHLSPLEAPDALADACNALLHDL